MLEIRGLGLLIEVMNRNIYLGDVYIEMIVNALGVGEIVNGDHVKWKLEEDLQAEMINV